MCMVGGAQYNDPVLPPESAQMRSPDAGAARSSAARRTMDRVMSGAKTVLTSGQGVTQSAPTEKKVLLGQ